LRRSHAADGRHEKAPAWHRSHLQDFAAGREGSDLGNIWQKNLDRLINQGDPKLRQQEKPLQVGTGSDDF
jgi:hypothetical protein